jgi:hypothetical protein
VTQLERRRAAARGRGEFLDRIDAAGRWLEHEGVYAADALAHKLPPPAELALTAAEWSCALWLMDYADRELRPWWENEMKPYLAECRARGERVYDGP